MFSAVEVIDTLLCNNSVAFHLNGVVTQPFDDFKYVQNGKLQTSPE